MGRRDHYKAVKTAASRRESLRVISEELPQQRSDVVLILGDVGVAAVEASLVRGEPVA